MFNIGKIFKFWYLWFKYQKTITYQTTLGVFHKIKLTLWKTKFAITTSLFRSVPDHLFMVNLLIFEIAFCVIIV